MSATLRRLILAVAIFAAIGSAQLATPKAAHAWWSDGYGAYGYGYPTWYYPPPVTAYYPGAPYYQGFGPPYYPGYGPPYYPGYGPPYVGGGLGM